ncbi:MAG TPA: hypothetical protein VGO47_08775 [Chlamydiales bacterium]|nr:hypothetical protein [Chlamydiales bacterium]
MSIQNNSALDLLFPPPLARPASVLSPAPPPGITAESTAELVRLLKENHVQFHCFFNDKGFHKYSFPSFQHVVTFRIHLL